MHNGKPDGVCSPPAIKPQLAILGVGVEKVCVFSGVLGLMGAWGAGVFSFPPS